MIGYKSIVENGALHRLKAHTASGPGAIQSDWFDRYPTDYNEHSFFTTIPTVGADTRFYLEHADDDPANPGTPLADSIEAVRDAELNGADADPNLKLVSGDIAWIVQKGPLKQHVRVVVDRGATNSQIGEIYMIGYEGRFSPQEQPATTKHIIVKDRP